MNATTQTPVTHLNKAPGYRWWILVMNMLAYGMVFLAIQTTNAYYEQIQGDWNLTATELSLLTMGFMLAYAFSGGLGGRLTTALGAKRAALIGLLVLIVPSALIPFLGTTFWGLVVLRTIQGISGGILATPTITSTLLWFPIKQRGLANGLLLGILGFGLSIATFFAPIMLAAGLTWQWGITLVVVVPSAIIFLLYALTVKEIRDRYPDIESVADLLPQTETHIARDDSGLPGSLKEAMRTKRFWACVIFGFCLCWLVYGFSAFLPTLLTVDLGFSSAETTKMISAAFIVTILSAPFGGIISDLVFGGSRYQTLVIGFGVTAACLVAIPVAPSSSVGMLLILAFGAVNFCIGTFWAIPTEMVKPEAAADTNGRVTLIACCANFLVGPLLSLTIDATASGTAALYICFLVAVLGVACVFVIRR